jgi:hypothetical protein
MMKTDLMLSVEEKVLTLCCFEEERRRRAVKGMLMLLERCPGVLED